MEDCVELARRLGERVGRELPIPVYLYEYAASRPERQSLADVRKGEYEALPEKVKDAGSTGGNLSTTLVLLDPR